MHGCTLIRARQPYGLHGANGLRSTRKLPLLELGGGEDLERPEQAGIVLRINHPEGGDRMLSESFGRIEASHAGEAIREAVQDEPGAEVIRLGGIGSSGEEAFEFIVAAVERLR